MNMTTRTTRGAACLAAALALSGCGGAGGSSSTVDDGSAGVPVTPPASKTATTPGVWTGTVSSAITGQSAHLLGLTDETGHSLWMASDGRVWHGDMPVSGVHFETDWVGHMSEGALFPDGSSRGLTHLDVDHHLVDSVTGQYVGCGDSGAFDMALSPTWSRPASPGELAGVYTRSTSSGYTMTLAADAGGHLHGSDTQGCVFDGTVTVPDAAHNLYGIDMTVTNCGSLDGHYQGAGTLLDANAMQNWMSAMHPLEHGGHSHGATGGGSHMMGRNTVPTGMGNLFMFSLTNGHNGLMDALAR